MKKFPSELRLRLLQERNAPAHESLPVFEQAGCVLPREEHTDGSCSMNKIPRLFNSLTHQIPLNLVRIQSATPAKLPLHSLWIR